MERQRIRFWMIAIALASVLALQTAAQEKSDLQAAQRIRREGLESGSKVMDYLSWLSDVYGPRISESPQYRKAGEWTVKTLTEIGLVNARMETWGNFGRGWELKKVYAAMTAPQYMPLIAYPKGWTPGTNGLVSGEAVLITVEKAEDLQKYKGKLKGAVVLTGGEREVALEFTPRASRLSDEELKSLTLAPEPGRRPEFGDRMADMMGRRQLQEAMHKFFREEGAIAVLEPSRWSGGPVLVSRGGSQAAGAVLPLPSLVVSTEQYNRIVRIMQKNLPVSLEIEIDARFTDDDPKGYNVVAEIPGTDKRLKDQVVMLGGHFDTWHAGTGATDNGSGCAVAMEAVRILKAMGLQPRRTVRIGLWDAEEQGFMGSRGYVTAHFYDRTKKEKKPEYDLLSVYFNFDNGSGKIRGIHCQNNIAAIPIFEAWLKPFHDLGATAVVSRNTGGTDHLSFDGVGLPGFQFVQDPLDYETVTHHSNLDVVDHCSKSDLMQAATIMAWFVYNAAMRDEMMPRKHFDPKDIRPDRRFEF